jgi:hypothetical protein
MLTWKQSEVEGIRRILEPTHLSLREDMHPLALLQLINAKVHSRLVDTVASYHRKGFPQHEEERVQPVREADVVG